MTTRIFLIRHGATAANRANPYRLQGRSLDPELDPLGRTQAERTAEVLAGRPLDAVYTSPLLRAAQTAFAVGRPHGLEPIVVSDLIEATMGAWEGRTWGEVETAYPDEYRRFLDDPGSVPYLDGESFADVEKRVSPVLAELAMRHEGGRIAVVGHNVVNRAVLAGILGLPMRLARTIRQANGGINIMDYEETRPIVVTMNACLHLEITDIERAGREFRTV